MTTTSASSRAKAETDIRGFPEAPEEVRGALPAMFPDETFGDDERPIVPPRDPLEEDLVRLWADVLTVTHVSIEDDFFDLGGHSLTAAAMVAKAGELFDREIPLSLLLENPTLAGFADALVREAQTKPQDVVAVQTQGSRPPLFFLHGDFNGGGLYCARLARALPEQPFYSLAPFGCEGGSPPASIEAMAALHAAAIRSVRPRGPYLLGGYCAGALEALEIARLFIRDGHHVPAVVLIEPTPIDPWQRVIQRLLSLATPILHLNDVQRVDVALRLAEGIRNRTQHPATVFKAPLQVRRWIKTLRAGSTAAGRADESHAPVRHDRTVWDHYCRSVAAYAPRRYDGSAGVFVAEEVLTTPADPSESWRRLGQRVDVHVLRGGHLSCITTHAAFTASAVDRYLAACLRA